MADRRPLEPADIRRQVFVEELDLSADGRLAIVVRRADQLKYATAPADDEDAQPKGRKGNARVDDDPAFDEVPVLVVHLAEELPLVIDQCHFAPGHIEDGLRSPAQLRSATTLVLPIARVHQNQRLGR